MRRPLSDEGSSFSLRVRLTPAQIRQLVTAERQTGQTRSIIIRDLLDKHFLTAPAPTTPGTNEQLERQLAI